MPDQNHDLWRVGGFKYVCHYCKMEVYPEMRGELFEQKCPVRSHMHPAVPPP